MISAILETHHCDTCDRYLSFFNFITTEELKTAEKKHRVEKSKHKDSLQPDDQHEMDIDPLPFPPPPPSPSLIQCIINGFCSDSSPSEFEESGCTVCGQLCPSKDLTSLARANIDFNLLCKAGVSHVERKSEEDPISELTGPVIDTFC